MFKSAWDGALPVYVIGTALVMVFSTLLKTDERRSSVTLWDRSAQSQTPQKSHLPGRSRGRGIPFASVLIRTACPVGKPNRPSSLIRCHGSFWAESVMSASVRGLLNRCRLGGLERLAVAAKKPLFEVIDGSSRSGRVFRPYLLSHSAVQPPSITMLVPVISADASEARNKIAPIKSST